MRPGVIMFRRCTRTNPPDASGALFYYSNVLFSILIIRSNGIRMLWLTVPHADKDLNTEAKLTLGSCMDMSSRIQVLANTRTREYRTSSRILDWTKKQHTK